VLGHVSLLKPTLIFIDIYPFLSHIEPVGLELFVR